MDNFEDNIRPPDNSIREQLLEDDRSDFQKQIDEALYLSMQEWNQEQIHQKQYEEKIMQEYQLETDRRRELFKDFLFNLRKIGKYDKEVNNVVELLEPIIDHYCLQYIEQCELEEFTYRTIFNTLQKIRNQSAVSLLKSIILLGNVNV